MSWCPLYCDDNILSNRILQNVKSLSKKLAGLLVNTNSNSLITTLILLRHLFCLGFFANGEIHLHYKESFPCLLLTLFFVRWQTVTLQTVQRFLKEDAGCHQFIWPWNGHRKSQHCFQLRHARGL